MGRVRSYRRNWLIEGLAISAAFQGVAFGAYELTRPEPNPVLTIALDGEGLGQVLVIPEGQSEPAARCGDGDLASCRIETTRGRKFHLVAVPGEKSTFEGWAQLPMRTPKSLVPYSGDPLATCLDLGTEPGGPVRDILDCPVQIQGDLDVAVSFGLQPEEVEVAWTTGAPIEDVMLPPIAPPVPKVPIDAEKLEEMQDDAVDVALAPVPPELLKQPPPVPPPPPEEAKKEEKKELQPPPNMTMVEVPDENEVKEAPDDATHLSDKNRDVKDETRATETNLHRESKGEQTASVESPDTTSPEVGGPDHKIRQLEEQEKTTDERVETQPHSGQEEVAKGVKPGEEGEEGQEGTGGVLAMRGIQGRGKITEQGDGKKRGTKGTAGVKTQLEFTDYKRILGDDKVEKERQIAAAKMSAKKGRWERKLAAIKSSLENFTPDVKPGNQTALKTRAHPFALYVARMHRRIHELWGFGFLESLDEKPADFALNDFELFVNIEVSLNPDGTVHKTTIAKTSGKLEFDVAALDTIISAAPYEETPDAIRSVDGRVYLRWGFYRNWRQCGTFNVEPYILTSIPGGAEPLDDGAMVKNTPKRGNRPVTPTPKGSSDKPGPTSTITDDKALYAANLWVSGYATAQVDKMLRFSATPFTLGEVQAQTTKDLKTMYEGLIVESGKLKDWKLVTVEEYAKRYGRPIQLGEGGAILLVQTQKTHFALILQKTRSGDYRAKQLVR